MTSAASRAAITATGGNACARARSARDGATAAWLCALPCAAIAAVTIVVLGPPLGELLSPARNPYRFFAGAGPPRPEPTEHARYLLAMCVPLFGALAVATAPRWLPRVPSPAVRPLAAVTQLTLAAVVVASLVAQYRLRFGVVYTGGREPTLTVHYFDPATLAVAALLAGIVGGALRSESLRTRAAAALSASHGRTLLIGSIAALATALWMVHAVHTDLEIGNAPEGVRYHLGFTLDETFAVINGRTPLVDFAAQYGSLLPYPIALSMLAFGKTVLTFTVVLCAITTLALLAIYGVLRRAAGSALAALALYLPFLATSLFFLGGTRENRSSVGSYYANFPLRYALPFLLAWLTARRIQRSRDDFAGAWLLFTVGGLAVLNNSDFGLAALGASVAALLWSAERPGRSGWLRLAGAVAAGLASAFALVSLLTLMRAGSLPQLDRLLDYARTYAIGGFAMMPIPGLLGLHLLVYLTYVAAIVVATVRALRGARGRVLTGMLAWAGVFGLGAGAYWVGRSHPVALKHQFSAWALALTLLTIVAARELTGREWRRGAIGALVVLFGFGVIACSLAQAPTPWSQLERLRAPFTPTEDEPDANPLAPSQDPTVRRFVASLADGRGRFVVRRGAPVAILLTTGHRVADAYGVVNVSPYTGIESLQTERRLEAVLDALRAKGGNTAILPNPLDPSMLAVLQRRGFELMTQDGLRPYVRGRTRPLNMLWPGGGAIIKWVDARHLHAEALR